MNDKIQTHERHGKIKTVIMVVSLILVVALAAGLIAQSVISSKRNDVVIEPPTVSDEAKGESNNFIITPEENEVSLMSLMVMPFSADAPDEGISAQADNSYNIKATIKPDNASVQAVNWSAAWKNTSSSWASGKAVSNYVTVTPSTSDPLTATVSCSEAFGEQVIITATTKDGTNLSAQCTCDYVKRVTKVNLVVTKSYMDDDIGFDTAASSGPWYIKFYPNVGSTGDSYIRTTPVLGVGTIEEEFTTVVNYALSSNYYSVLSSKGYTITSDNYAVINNATRFDNSTSGCKKLFGNNFFSDVGYANAVISSLSVAGNCVVFTVTTTGAYSSCTNTYQAFVNTSAMSVKATSVNIGDSNLKF